MIRTVKIIVSGRVQGVYFRKFTQHKAKELDIFGTVRNTDDGRVEIIAQANKDRIDPFIKWCRKGPVTARVEQVEIHDLPNENDHSSFKII